MTNKQICAAVIDKWRLRVDIVVRIAQNAPAADRPLLRGHPEHLKRERKTK